MALAKSELSIQADINQKCRFRGHCGLSPPSMQGEVCVRVRVSVCVSVLCVCLRVCACVKQVHGRHIKKSTDSVLS